MRQSLAVSVLVSRGLTTRLDAIFDVANSMLASRRDIPGKRLKLPKLTRHRTRRDLSVHWHTNPKHQPARASPRFLTRFKKRPLAVWICDLEHAFFLSIDRPRKDSQALARRYPLDLGRRSRLDFVWLGLVARIAMSAPRRCLSPITLLKTTTKIAGPKPPSPK